MVPIDNYSCSQCIHDGRVSAFLPFCCAWFWNLQPVHRYAFFGKSLHRERRRFVTRDSRLDNLVNVIWWCKVCIICDSCRSLPNRSAPTVEHRLFEGFINCSWALPSAQSVSVTKYRLILDIRSWLPTYRNIMLDSFVDAFFKISWMFCNPWYKAQPSGKYNLTQNFMKYITLFSHSFRVNNESVLSSHLMGLDLPSVTPSTSSFTTNGLFQGHQHFDKELA